MQIRIAIDNGSNNTVGGSDYSIHQAVSKFSEHKHRYSQLASCVDRKCQNRAGVSGDVDKTFECVTITDCMFSNRVLV